MKHLIILAVIVFSAFPLFAQKSSEIVQKGITVKRQYDKDVEDGDKEFYIDQEEFYDFRGEIIESKEYGDHGKKIKKWMKYKFDNDGNLLEELELDEKGEQVSRTTYTYENGLRMERNEYDAKNRLKKIRKYEYGYRK